MTLLLITLTVIVVVLSAIEFSQAAAPRRIPIWNDDTERQWLRGRRRELW